MFTTVDIIGAENLKIRIDTECAPECRIGNQHFLALIRLEYVPRAQLCMEFASFDAWVNSFNITSTTVEELCLDIFEVVRDKLKPKYLSVHISAVTQVHSPVKVVRKEHYE